MAKLKVRQIIKGGKTEVTSNSNDDLLKFVKLMKVLKKYKIKL
jgi:uncharacterized protein YajQ (UPF0234 family)